MFKRRYIRFYGTRAECAENLTIWHLNGLVNSVISEIDFDKRVYKDYKELDLEWDK